jgi:hypothetical protein
MCLSGRYSLEVGRRSYEESLSTSKKQISKMLVIPVLFSKETKSINPFIISVI